MQQPPPQTDEFPRIQLISTTDPHRLRPGAPAAIEYFPPYKNEWNTKADILSIILAANADSRSSVIKTESSPRPCSGAQFIYPRLDGSWFKNDGYIWRKRNNGRNIREDHLKLKVQGQTQVIEAKHVHSAIVPTFHRRVYFIPESSHVLVHYLNEKNDYKMADRAEEIAKCMINNNVFIPLQQLHEQLSPIFYQHTDQLVLEVNEHLRAKGVNLPTSPLPEPAPRELERRNSCSSAFRKGLSSAALRRQPSANSEIDANHIGTMLKRYGCNGNSSTVSPIFHSIQSHHPNHQAMESRSPSGDDDYQQMSVKSSTNVSTPASAFAEKMKIRSPPTAISEMTPTSCSLKGGQKLMIVGAYYKKVHDYKISFGRGKLVPATMIHPGVLSCIIPGSSRPETVQVRVFSNGQAVSTTADFTYEPPEHFQRDTDDKLMQIFEKIRIMACAFNAYSSIENIQSSSCIESILTILVQQIDNEVSSQNPNNFRMELLNGSRQFPSKTVLHLVAAFDYDRLFEVLVDLGRKIPECRELSLFSRDQDGSTPLHTAFKHGASRTARLIMSIDGNAINVMDDRGRTPADVAPDSLLDVVEKNNEEERVNATELWVMTNGNPFSSDLGNISRTPIAERTDDFLREATSSYSIMSYEGPLQAGNSRECDEDCESCCDPSGTEQLHVEIAMDTDVHVPDSPKMARLFQAVTSPGIVVTPNARARMADLARQIIEALPDRIKRSSEVPDDDNPGGQEVFYPNCDHLVDEYIEMMTERPQETSEAARSAQLFASNFFDDRSFASSSTRANTFESDTLDFDKDLGEFFTHHVDRFVDPIQQRLANLKYNDDEQRDVYEAAMVIQRAYRVYRARNTTRRQEDLERRAALKIQGCYRRYKQFCYFKKLHNAAIVVQKHFRMRKRDDKEESVEAVIASVPEHPTLDGQTICIQVPKTNSTLLRERAATTIQVAYRYRHRKRQAAARKIQNFMRQNRNNQCDGHPQILVTENARAKRRRCVDPKQIGGGTSGQLANSRDVDGERKRDLDGAVSIICSQQPPPAPPSLHLPPAPLQQQQQPIFIDQTSHVIINGTN